MRRVCANSSAAAMSMSIGRILVYRRAAQLAQVAAGGEHHGQDGRVRVAQRLEHPQHPRVIEARGEREFALEHLPRGFGAGELRIQDLQRDVGVAQFVMRTP